MKADRLLGITLILLEKECVSASFLADAFEVSTRTIYRDVEALSMAGVPVFSTPGVGGGIRIMPGFKLEKGMFNNDDLSTMLVALSGLEGIVERGTLTSAKAKLQSLISSNQAPQVQLKAGYVRIDRFPWIHNCDVDAHLARIREALSKCNLVSMTYLNQRGEESRRFVEPHQIVFKNGAPYVYGWCRNRRSFRLFKLTRILDLHVLEETFEPRDIPLAELDGTPYARELQSTISLRIKRPIAERVLDYCPFKDFAPDGDDHYLVSFPFIDRDYYYDMLLSFGEDCEVLGPPDIRKKMADKTRRLSDAYADGASTRAEGAANLRAAIAVFEPFNEQEAADKQVILNALDTDPSCFERSTQAHMTCSIWVVDPVMEQTMLVYHNTYGSWSWIGGHADGERDLQVVALRELEEETGVAHAHIVECRPGNVFALEVLAVDGHEKRGEYVSSHLHLNVTYLAVVDPAEPIRPKLDENSGVRWVPLEDAIRLSTEPWIRRRVYRKLIDKLALLT